MNHTSTQPGAPRPLSELLEEALRGVPSESVPSSAQATPPPGSALGPSGDTPAAGRPAPRSPSDLPRASEDLPFQRLGCYRILARLGSGGMAHVYRGHDESLDRTVAIKVLPDELAKQLHENVEAAAAAMRLTKCAESDEERQAALNRKNKYERNAASLRKQLEEQQQQVDRIELDLAKADAMLARLRSQRDVLNARLRAAEIDRIGGEARTRPRRLTAKRLMYASGVLASVAVVAVLVSLFGTAPRRPERLAPENTSPTRPEPTLAGDRTEPELTEVFFDDFESAVSPNWSKTTTSVTPAGNRRFLGEFATDQVSLALDALPPHEQVTLEFDLYVLKSWEGNQLPDGRDIWSLRVAVPASSLEAPAGDIAASRAETPHPTPDLGRTEPAATPAAGGAGPLTAPQLRFGPPPAVKHWDPASATLRKTLSAHGDYLRAVAFSPDGSLLAVGDAGRIKLFDFSPAGTTPHPTQAESRPPAEPPQPPAGSSVLGVTPDPQGWILLPPLVEPGRDAKDAGWKWDGEVAEFGAGKVRATVSFPLSINGSYELQTRVTITRAKEVTAIWLPVVGDKAAVLGIAGDNGNTESPTATISLKGLTPVPEPKGSVSVNIGTEEALWCSVIVSGTKAELEVRRNDQVLFQWSGDASQIAEMPSKHPKTLHLETARYTTSRFKDLRLRLLSGQATALSSAPASPHGKEDQQ